MSSVFGSIVLSAEIRGTKRRNEARLSQLLEKNTPRREIVTAATDEGSCHAG